MIDAMQIGPYTISLEPGDDAENPTKFTDIPIVIFHSEYDHLSTADLSDYGLAKIYGSMFVVDDNKDEGEWVRLLSIEDIADHLRKRYGAEVLRIKAYEHGTIVLSASPSVYGSFPDQQWDVTHGFGLIFMTRDQMAAWHDTKRVSKKMRNQCRDVMVSLVDEFSSYLSGDVWQYEINDANGDTVDSCGGIIGYDWARQLALETAHNAIMQEIVEPNTYIAGEGSVRSLRLDDELGATMAYVRISRDDTTRPRWRAVVDRANIDDRVVLVHRGTLDQCMAAAMDHFVDVVCGKEPDWLNVTRVHTYREEAA